MEQDSPINFSRLKDKINEKLSLEDCAVLIKTKSSTKCRLHLINNEAIFENEILYSFLPHERMFVYEAFLTDLCLTYEFPLNGYITSCTPYDCIIKKTRKKIVNKDTVLLFNCDRWEVKFPIYVCNYYTNSTPVMLDTVQLLDNKDPISQSLTNLVDLILKYHPECEISTIERCVLNNYDHSS